MLKIFKGSPLKTSILDDFMFYEERQKIMQKEKSRFTGRSYSTYTSAVVSANKPGNLVHQNDSVDPTKEDGGQSSVALNQPVRADSKQGFDDKVTTDTISADTEHERNLRDDSLLDYPITLKPDAVKLSDHQITSEPSAVKPSDDKIDISPDQKGEDDVAGSIIKMGSLSIGSGEGSKEAAESTQADMIVGSMPIKVNGTTEAVSKDKAIRSIPLEPKATELNQKCAASDGNLSHE